jgi:hypothetical protein
MVLFKISIIDRLVTITENGIEQPFLQIEIPMPLYDEETIQFYKPELWTLKYGMPHPLNNVLAFEVVRDSDDPINEDKDAIIGAFKEWYGPAWNDETHSVEYYHV